MERDLGRFENITHAADRMDQFGLKRIIHLCPQAAHYHIDYIRIGFESYIPDVLCNFITRYNFARRMRQMGEQQKLLGAKIQRNAAALGALMAHIDFQIVDAQLVSTRRRATQKRTHTREQFGKGKWFHYIIVRPELQPFYPVAHAVAGRQKDDGRLDLGRAQFFDESPSIFFWQHDVDDEKLEPARARRCQPSFSIEREIDDETSFAQPLCQKSRRLLF